MRANSPTKVSAKVSFWTGVRHAGVPDPQEPRALRRVSVAAMGS
jgi:hypothetical protein